MSRRWIGWSVLGGLVGGAIAAAIAWSLAGDDVRQIGDWRGGALRFVGMVTALGAAGSYLATRRLTRGPVLTRSGFALSYRRIEPGADGYRDLKTVTVADLLVALRAVGYDPQVEACDDLGLRRGAIRDTTPLAGANVAVCDPRVRGWIRVQLPAPAEGQARGLGLIEVWSARGESAEELGLFALRGLDGLVGGLTAAPDTSQLGEDKASLLVSALPDRPEKLR